MTRRAFMPKGGFLRSTVLLALLFVSAGCGSYPGGIKSLSDLRGLGAIFGLDPPYKPDEHIEGPVYFKADYSEVWGAAKATLVEYGFIIEVMNRAEGYMATNTKDFGSFRESLSINISIEAGAVKVKVDKQGLDSSTTYGKPKRRYWSESYDDGYYQWKVSRDISGRIGKPYVLKLTDIGGEGGGKTDEGHEGR